QCAPRPHKAVEQGRFAHIGTTDNGDGKGHDAIQEREPGATRRFPRACTALYPEVINVNTCPAQEGSANWFAHPVVLTVGRANSSARTAPPVGPAKQIARAVAPAAQRLYPRRRHAGVSPERVRPRALVSA